ncbi:MAG: hypothetical protein HYW48_10025 [Deltaproteobacteria bacterium]|nr:hypothetical protein [Deltaproteobacteria bacterium]
MFRSSRILISFSMLTFTSLSYGFEHTKVLPKGVRQLNIKSINTSIGEKSSGDGVLQPLATALEKDLTFQKIVDKEDGIKKMLAQALLHQNFAEGDNLDLEKSIGHFTADMKGNIAVTASFLSYGVTENLTLALVVPYYQAKMNVDLGFAMNETGHKFVGILASPAVNKVESAIKASNPTVGFREKLRDNGMADLQAWKGSGLGDIVLASKLRFLEAGPLSMAATNGLVFPTGAAKDPNNLIDIPFGKNSYAFFTAMLADESITDGLFFNQYAKYTTRWPSRQDVRLKTAKDPITDDVRNVNFRLGDEWEVGGSLQFEPSFGLLSGIGVTHMRKFRDHYRTSVRASDEAWEDGTDERASYAEALIGYSSLPSFKRKEFPVPFSVALEAKQHLASTNSVRKDMYTLDVKLYF